MSKKRKHSSNFEISSVIFIKNDHHNPLSIVLSSSYVAVKSML